MEHKASRKNKKGINADETRSDKKRNIPDELPSAITHLYSTYSTNIADCAYLVYITDEKETNCIWMT
jgi:hypothetical protein